MCYTFSQREYKKALEQEIKGKGMLALATDTPDFMRARNATDILSQVGVTPHVCPVWPQPSAHGRLSAPQTKYKQNAEMDRATYTTVIDTPDILHAQQMKNIVSQVDPPPPPKPLETSSGRFFTLGALVQQKRYKEDAEKTMSHYVPVLDTPEMQRVRENQKNFSTVSND